MSIPLFCRRKFICFFGMRRILAVCLMLCFLQQSAYADIWGFVDQKGVADFAAERVDERYEIFFRSGESFDTTRDVKTVGVPAIASRVMAYFEVSPSYKVVKLHMREAASAHHVDYELLAALIATESGFDAMAVSPKGAIGLMQLMPATAVRYGVAGDKKRRFKRNCPTPASISQQAPTICATCLTFFLASWSWHWPPITLGKAPCSVPAIKFPTTKRRKTT